MTRHNAAARILGSGFYVPSRVVTNDDLAAMFDTSDEWIRQRSGIVERHYISPGESGASMGAEAARAAVADAGLELTDIDAIIVATLSPDYSFPGTGVFMQDILGLNGCACMDVRNQCTGLLYAMATADAWIRAGLHKNILVVGTEIHSTGLEFADRGRDVTVLFGDGASAVVIGPTDDPDRGFLGHKLHADGSGAKFLWIENPACCNHPYRFEQRMVEDGTLYPRMNGRAVFKWACTRLPEVIGEVLQSTGYTLDDVDLLVPHQANMRINEMVAKQMRFPPEKVMHNIQKYGNTTAASIGIALHEARTEGRVPEGSLVLLAAFGSGFTWASTLVRF
jgi:3-oxoacyl-[acyl-carrier-protein] synthase III